MDVGLPTNEQTELAVIGWLNSHPEATTTVQDNSLELNKLTNEARQKLLPVLQIEVTSTSTRAKWAGGELEHHYLQSMCYDSTRHYYIIGCSSETNANNSKIFVLRNFSFTNESIVTSIEPQYQYCNDMTYDAKTDHIFIASGENKIYEIDALNLELISVRGLEPSLSVWQISAYSDGSFVVGVYDSSIRNERLLHYNSSFTNFVEISVGIKNTVATFLE